MKRVVDVVTATLAVVALVLGGQAVWRLLNPSPSVLPRLSEEPSWRTIASAGSVVSSDTLAVTIVEFGDFECVFCQRFAVHIDSLRSVGVPVRFVYRHALNGRSPTSIAAARASECARQQGHFPSAYNLLMRSPNVRSGTFDEMRKAIGVPDSAGFLDCLEEGKWSQVLREDSIAASRLNVRGTPTILVENMRYDGLPAFDSLFAFVQRVRSGAVSALR